MPVWVHLSRRVSFAVIPIWVLTDQEVEYYQWSSNSSCLRICLFTWKCYLSKRDQQKQKQLCSKPASQRWQSALTFQKSLNGSSSLTQRWRYRSRGKKRNWTASLDIRLSLKQNNHIEILLVSLAASPCFLGILFSRRFWDNSKGQGW